MQALSLTQAGVLLLGLVNAGIIAHILGPEGNGLLAMTFLLPGLLASLGGLGVADAVVYFGSKERYSARLTSNIIVVAVALGGMYTVLLILGSELLAATILVGVPASMVAVAAQAIPFEILRNSGSAYLLARGENKVHNALQFVFGLLFILLTLAALTVAGAGFWGPIWALVGANVISGSIYLVVLHRLSPRGFMLPSLVELREMLGYGVRVLVGNLAQKVNYRLDFFVVNYFLGPSVVGIYSVVTRVAEAFLVAPRALRVLWFREVSRGDRAAAASDTLRIYRWLLPRLFVSLPVFGAAGMLVIAFVFGSQFLSGLLPFWILLASVFALSASMPLVASLAGVNRPGMVSVAAWISVVATLLLNLSLVPGLGMTGAALASLGAYGAFFGVVFLLWSRTVAGGSLALDVDRKEMGRRAGTIDEVLITGSEQV